ncbi:transglutaminase-like domain-containing protein [Pinibacter aurantiacus]|uniref:DUF3858 domain-containing protein n=1 Tax=Pinibacter aurantiacus TaxID=2851599 RepID=A0A9E2SE76_9BACT|nr:transglutaminase-like domain-containing protein [Pinibacter aurantiacus]MBV4359429.1 DUF3858 domain-containing protein [Pinibacter aurantiacus]
MNLLNTALKKTAFLSLSCLPLISFCQDYPKMAKDLQQQFKDDKAYVLNTATTYEFSKDSKAGAKVEISGDEDLLSLRYNDGISLLQVYDGNSKIEKFYAESNLHQKAPDDKKVCGTYTSDGLFFDDSKFCGHQLRLKEVGEVWHTHFEKKIYDAKYLSTIFFPSSYPTAEKKIKLVIPKELDIEIKEFNFDGYSIKKSETADGSDKVIEYTATKLKGMKTERAERGMQYTYPHLLILPKSANVSGKQMMILSSNADLYNWYSGLASQLQPNRQALQSTVNQLTKDKKTDEEKVKAIYYWVQDNIRYIAFEDGVAAFKPDEAQHVFEKKYGDCKGMANLTKEMLKAAGFDARLTWIGTRHIMYESIPTLAANNHMICTLILNGKKYFLDGTEKYVPFGENALRIQGRPAMIEDGNKFILEKIPVADSDADVRNVTATINGEALEGKCTVTLKGESKKNFLYQYHYTKNDDKSEWVNSFASDGNDKIKITNLKLPNLDQREGMLSFDCNYSYPGAVSSFNNECYVDLDPSKSFQSWVIKDDRQSDVDFEERIHEKITVTLAVPQGYKVATLPDNINIKEPEFSFNVQYKQEGDKVIYTKELNIPEGVIQKKNFSKWNNAVKELIKSYDNQIVLKK